MSTTSEAAAAIPATNGRPRRLSPTFQRPIARLAAGGLLAALILYLVWGWVWQKPGPDPWAPPSFWAAWLSPRPDKLYDQIPVPMGEAGGLVPADLCRREQLGLVCDDPHALRLVGPGISA